MIAGIQLLRGFAAMLVVFHHAIGYSADHHPDRLWQFGQAGVDIFFVISGFIIWTTSNRSGLTPGTFLTRRITRIYPLYWVFLLVMIGIVAAVPASFPSAPQEAWHLVTSFLLFPAFHPYYTTQVWPYLVPGWSLQFEMYFYIVFALALWLPARVRLAALLAVFAMAGVAGILLDPQGAVPRVLLSPLVFEFCFGLLIAVLYPRLSLPPLVGWVLMLAGVVAIIMLSPMLSDAEVRGPLIHGWMHVGLWGIPSAAIVLGSLYIRLESYRSDWIAPRLKALGNRLPAASAPTAGTAAATAPLAHAGNAANGGNTLVAAVIALGDASYSIYLSHPLLIGVSKVVGNRIGWPGDGLYLLVYVCAVLLGAALLGLLVHRWLERPLLELTRRLNEPRQPAPAG